MTRNIILTCALIWLGLCQSACAQPHPAQSCGKSILKLVGEHFEINNFWYPGDDNGGVITAGVCKVWPRDRAITIAAFSYDDALVVAMIDNRNNKLIASYKDAAGDAIGMESGSLGIDTARYDLAPGVRAFGLDITESFRPSCADNGIGPVRALFVQDGEKIRPVLKDFTMSTWRYAQGGAPHCGAKNKEAITEKISYSIGIGKARTKGYANLIITAALSYNGGKYKPKRKPFRYELHYDGKQYPNSNAGPAFEKWLKDARPDKLRK